MNSRTNKEIYSHENAQWGNYGEDPLRECEAHVLQKYIKPTEEGSLIEAGTGSGRLVFNIEKMGVHHIDAFDFVSEFIEQAQQVKKGKHSNVNFFTADATNLGFIKSEKYEYIVYLQQIISNIPTHLMDNALEEAYRINKKGGIAIFSFLNYNGRSYNKILSTVLQILRKLRRENLSKYELPWLKLGNKNNYKFLNKGQVTNYWFEREDILARLKKLGYEILEVTSEKEIMHTKHEGMLYIVCKK